LAQVLVGRFPEWLDRFDRDPPFRRPEQLACHRRTIDRRFDIGTGAEAVCDETFLRSLYETLKAWGIGSRGSKLRPFDEFSAELGRHQVAITALESAALDDPALRTHDVSEQVWELIDSLSIVDNKAKVVSATKALHHVLPNLVVPMDREYTQVFFGWHNPQFHYGQRECFTEAFDAFSRIAQVVRPAEFVGSGWRSSKTKVLDNALVSVVRFLRAATEAN